MLRPTADAVLRRESEIHRLQPIERAQQQPGDEQHHQAEPDLCGNQRASDAGVGRRWRGRPRDNLSRHRRGGPKRRRNAEEYRGQAAERPRRRARANPTARRGRRGSRWWSACRRRGTARAMAHRTPTTVAASVSTPDSTSTCWSSRPRPAPIDARSAISRLRPAPRASRRLATFEHAMSRTTATIAQSATSGCSNSCRTLRSRWTLPRPRSPTRRPAASVICARGVLLRLEVRERCPHDRWNRLGRRTGREPAPDLQPVRVRRPKGCPGRTSCWGARCPSALRAACR